MQELHDPIVLSARLPKHCRVVFSSLHHRLNEIDDDNESHLRITTGLGRCQRVLRWEPKEDTEIYVGSLNQVAHPAPGLLITFGFQTPHILSSSWLRQRNKDPRSAPFDGLKSSAGPNTQCSAHKYLYLQAIAERCV